MSNKKQTPRQPANAPANVGITESGPQRPADDQTPAPSQSAEQKGRAPAGKLGMIADLLKRPEGATLQQLMNATDWQAHSVRGSMAGSLSRKHGLIITSGKTEAGRLYRAQPGASR